MKTLIFSQVVRIALPALAGALGAYMLTAYPAIHQAFCVGGA